MCFKICLAKLGLSKSILYYCKMRSKDLFKTFSKFLILVKRFLKLNSLEFSISMFRKLLISRLVIITLITLKINLIMFSERCITFVER